MTDPEELTSSQQHALFFLCGELLRHDLTGPGADSKLTLLWLEWADRNGSTEGLPTLGRVQWDTEYGSKWVGDAEAAIEILKTSGAWRSLLQFLDDIARENGINENEARWLAWLRDALATGPRMGPYR